jgi:hypothetical protein
MITTTTILVCKERLNDEGLYPKLIRLDRNKKFFDALPKSISKDLARWICKNYIDCESCTYNIDFTNSKQNRYGMHTISIKCSLPNILPELQPLLIKTPLCVTPFGMCNRAPATEDGRYTLNINIDTTNAWHKTFYDNILYIEETTRKMISKDSRKYFQRNVSSNALYDIFCSSISQRVRANGTDAYPPMFKMILNEDDKQCTYYNTDKVDKNKRHIPISFKEFVDGVQQMSEIQAIIHVSFVWLTASRFGITYKPIQIRYKTSMDQKLQHTYMFDDSDE